MTQTNLISAIQAIYGDSPVPLHRPVFAGDEKARLCQAVGGIRPDFLPES